MTTPASQDGWTEAMRRGDFAAAWTVADDELRARAARAETCWTWPRHLQFVWNGAPVAGRRVLVRCYHGLGDTLQFIRFVEPLRRLAARVTAWVQPDLLPLVATARGVDEVLPLHDGRVDAVFDVDVEVMEMAHVLRVDHASVAPRVPYLFPPSGDPHDLSAHRAFRVGIVWRAGSWDPRRSLGIDDVERLIDGLRGAPDVAVFSLQRDVDDGALRRFDVPTLPTFDVMATARSVSTLDLVISVDTMVAHLAGALGRPIFTLLHQDCDWRWTTRGAETPWYPTMRLFRQATAGDWRPVLDSASNATHDLSLRTRGTKLGTGAFAN